MNLLEIFNLTVSYSQKTAIKNISFNVEYNDYISILGYNGSGKSSMLKSILGIVDYEGDIKFNINKNEISYLSQNTKIPLDFPATIYEIVITGTQKNNKLTFFYSKDDHLLTKEFLNKLDIYHLKNKKIKEISGGQLQRVLLARALVKNPKLLILDEPCSSLDEEITKNFYLLLKELNEKNNMAILMVTHDMDNILEYSKHILLIDKYLKFFGNKNEWNLYKERLGKING